MSDKANIRIQDAFVTINFKDLEKYNPALGIEEIVFFQYLVFKCGSNAGEWWQSARNIELKLKIGRVKLAGIIKRFTGLGVLDTETKGFRNNRHYRLILAEVVKEPFLSQLYDWPRLSKHEQKAIIAVYEALLKKQPPEKVMKAEPVNVTTHAPMTAAKIRFMGEKMEGIWHDRRVDFNREKRGTRTLANDPKIFTPKHIKQLEKALVYFNSPEAEQYILNAFYAYCDEVNNTLGGNTHQNNILTEEAPKTDIFSFFLSGKDEFQTITAFSTAHSAYGFSR